MTPHTVVRAFIACVAGAVLISTSEANQISLYNTGVDNSRNVRSNGSLNDLHYTLTSVPGGSTTTTEIRTSAGGFPIPPWIGDNTTSTWIGPANDSSLDGPSGNYIYEITFSLAGLNPATAMINGMWSTDNFGVDILLNGVSTGQTAASGFTAFDSFSLTSGFVSGLNTIDFIVRNDGGPTGLRVEMSGTANPTGPVGVPEAFSTIWGCLLMLGLVGYSHCTSRREAT